MKKLQSIQVKPEEITEDPLEKTIKKFLQSDFDKVTVSNNQENSQTVEIIEPSILNALRSTLYGMNRVEDPFPGGERMVFPLKINGSIRVDFFYVRWWRTYLPI